MTIDPETLMAYADGALDPLEEKRVARAVAADPALAAEVARHRALAARIAGAYAPVATEPVPDRLTALIRANNVVPLAPRARRAIAGWRGGAALAASLALGIALGVTLDRTGQPGPVRAGDGGLYAAGPLASALDERIGGEGGAVRVAVSFRDRQGAFCRVFAARAADGIACRDADGWQLRRTQPGNAPAAGPAYAQAGSADPALLAAAQEMMAGAPLDAAGERAARAAGWR